MITTQPEQHPATDPAAPIGAFAKLAFVSSDEMTDFIGNVIDLAGTPDFNALIQRGQRPVLFACLLPIRTEPRVYVSDGLLDLIAQAGQTHWIAERTTMQNLPFGLSMLLGDRADQHEYSRTHS